MVDKNVIKRHLISAGITFIGTFLITICTTIASVDFTFTKDAIFAASAGALVTAARALVKIIWEIGSYLLSSTEE